MIAITVPFIFYPIWSFKKSKTPVPALLSVAVIVGLGFAGLALGMATSRGVVFAILSGAGGWLLWLAVNWAGIRRRLKGEAVFPILLMVYLCAVVAFLYVGPARSGSIVSGNYYFGGGSRAELFSRSIYLLLDTPITGGWVGGVPGFIFAVFVGHPVFQCTQQSQPFFGCWHPSRVRSVGWLFCSFISLVYGWYRRNCTGE